MIEEKYLPVGSVVLLKEATKKIMITGFCINNNEDNKMYDYLGCLYPEGVLSTDQNLLFNHDQIAEICFMGLKSEEDVEFKKKLNELINGENKEVASQATPVATTAPVIPAAEIPNNITEAQTTPIQEIENL